MKLSCQSRHAAEAGPGHRAGAVTPAIKVTMNADKHVTANFAKTYKLEISVSPANTGTVNQSSGTYKEGSVVTLSATPSQNNTFAHWSGTDNDSVNPTTVTMNTNKNLTAYFNSSPVIKITYPTPDSVVPQSITVKGTANSPVAEGKYLWILVKYSQQVWPQTMRVVPVFSTITQAYEWSVDAQVGVAADSGKMFNIEALIVPKSIDDEFMAWFNQGKKDPNFSWPGFDINALQAQGAQIMDIISVKRG